MKAWVQKFWQDEDGLQTVEAVLLLVVALALIGLFYDAALSWMGDITTKVSTWLNTV